MGPPTVLNEKPFQVARVEAPGGPEGAPEAFMRLEERMDSLRGSRMYGLLYPGEPTAYYACVRLDDDHSDDLGFDRAHVERVMTDNGRCYVSNAFKDELVAMAIDHTRTKPYCPRTNGKVERYNRTLLNEWAYARPYRSEAARTRALDKWLHMYNHHRHHTAIGCPPAGRVNNLAGQNT